MFSINKVRHVYRNVISFHIPAKLKLIKASEISLANKIKFIDLL